MKAIFRLAPTLALFAYAWGIAVSVPVPTGRSLRIIVADKYPKGNVFIGMAAHGESVSTNLLLSAILNREFSYVTPANDFKLSYIHSAPGQWQWARPDWWMAEAASNSQVIRVHGPISPQAPRWVYADERTPDELRTHMKEYLAAIVPRWSKETVVKWVDVVNETWSKGSWVGPKPGVDQWENPWLLLGMERGNDGEEYPVYIREAFEAWQNGDPRIKRIVNEHELSPVSCSKMKGVISHLRSKGLQVDGFGWQAHIDASWEKNEENMNLLHEMIDWCHRRGLEFHITEFQARIYSKEEKPARGNKNPNPLSAEDQKARLETQGETFRAVLSALLEHRERGVVALNYWHLTDDQSKEKGGNMFESDGTPRPAYYQVQRVLENPPKPR